MYILCTVQTTADRRSPLPTLSPSLDSTHWLSRQLQLYTLPPPRPIYHRFLVIAKVFFCHNHSNIQGITELPRWCTLYRPISPSSPFAQTSTSVECLADSPASLTVTLEDCRFPAASSHPTSWSALIPCPFVLFLLLFEVHTPPPIAAHGGPPRVTTTTCAVILSPPPSHTASRTLHTANYYRD